MGWYSSYVFPRLCEFGLNNHRVAAHRSTLLQDARGEILEIGIGSALNAAHYPSHVRRITAIDPNPGMHRWAAARIAETGLEVDKRILSSESLPFADESFDCVVSTFTLCSIADVHQALGEVYRVLRPGGAFLFLEHGLSPDPGVARWQRRLNGLERLLADNCHLDRSVRELVAGQPFAKVEIDEFYLPKTPRTHGYFSRGQGIK
ncbi:MAG: class I SAM-dependent methyltransferase [Planctomycetaceae bacterium]|nr:class I SAM-dependent methyltransferase [Planctomycetaceae bacterium]